MKEKIKDKLCTEMFDLSKYKSKKQDQLDEIFKKYSDEFKAELNK